MFDILQLFKYCSLKMKNRIYILLIIILIISACQPNVRFATKDEDSKSSKSDDDYRNKKGKYETPSKNDDKISSKQKRVINEAENWLGTPYCYGGETKNCADCSGYVKEVFLAAGVKLPRTATEQYKFGKEVSKDSPTPGDLVFFGTSKKISHVGIFLGNNYFIHSSTSRGVVRQSLNDSYYQKRFVGFRRVL